MFLECEPIKWAQIPHSTGFLADSTIPVVVVPDARERVSHRTHLCELPLTPAAASASGEAYASYDWSLVEASLAMAGGDVADWERGMVAADLEGSVGQRAARLRAWVERRPESTIVIVSHGAYLMRLTRDSYMQNCELRSYRVAKADKWAREDRLSVTNALLNLLPDMRRAS